MKIMNFVVKGAFTVSLKSKDKEGVLREMVGLLVKSGNLDKRYEDEVVKVLLQREGLGSTGIGNGIAIPHGKSDKVGKVMLAFGRSDKGIPFDALDGKPAHLFFLLVGPTNTASLHLKALARISRLLKNDVFRKRLMEAPSEEEVLKEIEQEDSRKP